MVIISKIKTKKPVRFKSAQFRYAATYVVITFIALLFLNIYCSKINQELFFNSKETAMLEKCKLASSEIINLDALNKKTVADAVSGFEDLNVSRLIITNQNGQVIYDTLFNQSTVDKYVLFPEVITALRGNDVFYWNYHDGATQSNAATPVYSYGTLIGCVYMMEYDTTQGALIASLQNNIFTITVILEIIVILFSLSYSIKYSRRVRKIMTSIRTVRQGDYTHHLEMDGQDELNSLSNEFNDLISRLQISENKRSQFVSDASHELKTPLAAIKLLSDSILQNSMNTETIQEFVADIGREADRLNRLSQKLLTLSRTDNQLDREHTIIKIAPTVERVVRMLSEIANDNKITIETNLKDDSNILILEDDLYQILFNLIENGIKYNTQNGVLSISLKQQDKNAIICIQDTGVGIPPDSIDHIFERFYRVDKARSRSTGGSGLGLSIVRSIVDRNNGTIRVISDLGIGTAFTLSFPVFDAQEVI